jgi:cholestenol delta-isomerase
MLTTLSSGYYIRNYKEITGQQTVLAQLWKEYALSDSRYLTGDTKVVCLEVITVVCEFGRASR